MIYCPLCLNKKQFTKVKGPDTRAYLECNRCNLIFTEIQHLPTAKNEKKRYLTHNNGIEHPEYVEFLNRAIVPSLNYINTQMKGLDFGCGPTRTLSQLLSKQNLSCENYDPFFFPELPEGPFDFIFATECFEHFFFPSREIKKLYELLKPEGILTIMTEKWTSLEKFSKWVYAKDNTHVSFYHEKSIHYIINKYGFTLLESNHPNVVILQKHVNQAY